MDINVKMHQHLIGSKSIQLELDPNLRFYLHFRRIGNACCLLVNKSGHIILAACFMETLKHVPIIFHYNRVDP